MDGSCSGESENHVKCGAAEGNSEQEALNELAQDFLKRSEGIPVSREACKEREIQWEYRKMRVCARVTSVTLGLFAALVARARFIYCHKLSESRRALWEHEHQ